MSANQELLTAIYAAFNRREIDAVLAALAPDVDWPNGMEGGRVRGRDQVRAYWTRQWAALDPHVEPVHIEDDADGRAVVEVHQVVQDLFGNILVDQTVHHKYLIQNGLVVRMDIQELTPVAVPARSS